MFNDKNEKLSLAYSYWNNQENNFFLIFKKYITMILFDKY